LAVSTKTLFNKTAPRGPIPVVKIGAAVRYRLADLDAFAASQARPHKPGASPSSS